MLSSVERLRMGLLVVAGLLVAVIGGFLWYAHYRTHRILRDLPGRLGASISKQFGAYTYSQSLQGRKIYTIRATSDPLPDPKLLSTAWGNRERARAPETLKHVSHC